VQEEVPPWAHAGVREAALLVSNHSMRAGDRGVVIAGGSAQAGDLAGHSAPGTQSGYVTALACNTVAS